MRQRNHLALHLLTLTLLLNVGDAKAQTVEMRREIAAMEQTLFSKNFCKDTPIRRVERLEENFAGASGQKSKDLRTRLNELIDKIQPSQELLQKGDPCDAQKKSGRSKFASFMSAGEPKGKWLQRTYPFVDWGARNVLGLEKGVSALKTEFDDRPYSHLKYDFIVKLPADTYPRFFNITLLDEHGFKLSSFTVGSQLFTKMKTNNNEPAFQAKEQVPFSEKNYKDARDYSVTPIF